MAVFDYNYRTPHVRLVAKHAADEKTGFGTVMRYGDHFKTLHEGTDLAKIRAERLAAGRRVYSGVTDCARFRVGHWFSLEGHDEQHHDGQYLITEIDHEAGSMPGSPGTRYTARFRAIALGVQFRPEQATPWPSIHGIMHGHVAAGRVGEARCGDRRAGALQGEPPLRLGETPRGRASRAWIRMAQPHSGPGYGVALSRCTKGWRCWWRSSTGIRTGRSSWGACPTRTR